MRRTLAFVPLALVAVVAIAVAPACSRKSATTDTCAFAKDQNNCWRKVVASVDACLGGASVDAGSSEKGNLSEDGRTCTYANGRTVAFTTPLASQHSGASDRDFTVSVNGKPCASVFFKTDASLIRVNGPAGLVVESQNGPGVGLLTCPDGSQHTFSFADFNDNDECAKLAYGGGLPNYQSFAQLFSFAGNPVRLYDCESN